MSTEAEYSQHSQLTGGHTDSVPVLAEHDEVPEDGLLDAEHDGGLHHRPHQQAGAPEETNMRSCVRLERVAILPRFEY